MEKTINFRLKRDFKKYLETPPTTSTYSSGYNSYGGYGGCYSRGGGYTFTPKLRSQLVMTNAGHDDFRECGANPINYMDVGNIFFYEFSSMSKGCRHYNSVSEFFKFLGDYGMTMSDESRRVVKQGTPMWCVCIPNKKEVIVRRSRMDLGAFISEYGDGKPVPDKVKSPYAYIYN